MYKIDNGYTITYSENADEVASLICESLNSDDYDEMLRECYGDKNGDIEICGLHYDVARIFEDIDPIAYRCGFSDYTDNLWSDMMYNLERMSHNECEDYYGYDVTYFEEEEEDEEEEEE